VRDDLERREGEPDENPGPTIIDVTEGRPEIVAEERAPSGGFVTTQFGRTRVYVAQSGTRACLVPLAVVLLLLCCACVGFWTLVDQVDWF
jgi:hypothetical protein